MNILTVLVLGFAVVILGLVIALLIPSATRDHPEVEDPLVDDPDNDTGT